MLAGDLPGGHYHAGVIREKKKAPACYTSGCLADCWFAGWLAAQLPLPHGNSMAHVSLLCSPVCQSEQRLTSTPHRISEGIDTRATRHLKSGRCWTNSQWLRHMSHCRRPTPSASEASTLVSGGHIFCWLNGDLNYKSSSAFVIKWAAMLQCSTGNVFEKYF